MFIKVQYLQCTYTVVRGKNKIKYNFEYQADDCKMSLLSFIYKNPIVLQIESLQILRNIANHLRNSAKKTERNVRNRTQLHNKTSQESLIKKIQEGRWGYGPGIVHIAICCTIPAMNSFHYISYYAIRNILHYIIRSILSEILIFNREKCTSLEMLMEWSVGERKRKIYMKIVQDLRILIF